MAYSFDSRAGFSNEGFRARRLNPGNSYPATDNHLGANGVIDCSALLAGDSIIYRFDATGDWTTTVYDISALGATETPTTLTNALKALGAPFTDVFTATVDVSTGRVKFADTAGGHDYMEIKGVIGIVCGFGGTDDAAAIGTQFVDCFDDSGAFTVPPINKDGEEIEQESGRGQIWNLIIDALHKGIAPSIALLDERYEFKEMLMGGAWDDTAQEYTPPTTDLINKPQCAMEFFVPKYAEGTGHRSDFVGYKMLNILRLTGMEGEVSHAVKAWAGYQYDCIVQEYVESGVKYPGYTEKELSIAEYAALGLPA